MNDHDASAEKLPEVIKPSKAGAPPPTPHEQALAALLRGLPEALLPSRYFERGAIAASDVVHAAQATSAALFDAAQRSGETLLGPSTFCRRIAAQLDISEERAERIFDWLQEISQERPFVFPGLVAERSDGDQLQLVPDQGLPEDLAFRWTLTRDVLEEAAHQENADET